MQNAFLEAVNQLVSGRDAYLDTLQDNLAAAVCESNPDSIESLDAKMADLQHELIARTSRHENYDDLAAEILRLRELREQTVMDDVTRTAYQNRIQELQAFIRSQPTGITTFDETLVAHLLSKVTVFEESLVFEFKSGVTVSVGGGRK